MSHYTSEDYEHLWLCLNHLLVYESDNGIELYCDTSFMCLCGVAGCVCWHLAWGHIVPQVYSLLCPKSLLAPALHPDSFHARQDWTDL